jgi:hypothetical protein
MEKPFLEKQSIRNYLLVSVFGIAFAVVEAAVVVYLRKIYYPQGFCFPLNQIADKMILVELFRELATMIMLASIGALAGRKFWERLAYFMIAFGIWDIFYYVWLKVFIGWPESLFTWDILFLIPLPWIGPVLAPILISIMLIISGLVIIHLHDHGNDFRPGKTVWGLSIAATAIILYSFMKDLAATLYNQVPRPYAYWMLAAGLVMYSVALILAYWNSKVGFTAK